MSRSLASYPEAQRTRVAQRRMAAQTKGNGYWAASDYLEKMAAKVKVKAK